MKLNAFYPFVAGLCTALFLVWACTQAVPTPNPGASAAKTTVADGGNIDPATAEAAILKWQQERDTIQGELPPAHAMYVVKGFRVPVKDIVDLFVDLQTRQIDSVWAMMAIMKSPGQTTDSTHLIFQAEKSKASGQAAKGGPSGYEYFDFSSPCPKNCPPNG